MATLFINHQKLKRKITVEDQFFYQRMFLYLAIGMFFYMMIVTAVKEIRVTKGLQKYCVSCN